MPYSEPMQAVLDKAGGPKALADALGVTPGAVTQWTKIPPRHMHRVSAFTGIPVEQIRPDLMPSAEAAE